MASYEKLKSGWSVRFRVVDKTNGKYINKRLSGFGTKRKAEQGYMDFVRDEGTTISTNKDITLGDLAKEYLVVQKSRTKESSQKSTICIFKIILDYFKPSTIINNITKRDLLKFYMHIAQIDYAINTKNSIFSRLKSLYKFAHTYYGIEDISNALQTIPNNKKKEPKVWTKKDLDTFLTFSKNKDLNRLIVLLFYTGLRIGEALALTKSDIKGNVISIDKSIVLRTQEITTPKNNSSVRKVIVHDNILNMISQIKTHTLFNQKYKTYYAAFIRTINSINVPKITLHGLRHSHASLLISKGADIVSVSKRLGHARIDMTLNTYSHLLPSADEKMLQLLGTI